jgi:hypothetical protein
MSLNIVGRCVGSSLIFRKSPAGGRALFLFGPVICCRVDEVGAEDFAGGAVGDGGFVFVDEDERWCAAVLSADSKVVENAGMPEGDFAVPVDGVDADSVVGAEGRCGGGLGWWRCRSPGV